MREASLWLVAFSAALLALGCGSPEQVINFAETANDTLDAGSAVFRDIPASCTRRHANAARITPVYLPSSPSSATTAQTNARVNVCAAFGPEADSLVKASDVLGAYFRAMQQLAAFDSSSVVAPTEQAGLSASTAGGLSATQIDSITKLSALVARVFTGHYQHRKLAGYLREADPLVANVTQGFETIVAKDYTGLLAEEQQSIAAQYQNAGGDTRDLAVVLLLNRSFRDDLDQLKHRQDAASAYVTALQQLRQGHHALAVNSNRMDEKAINLALQPYTSQLKNLLPVIQRGQ